jgi:hypothetical protein
MNVLFNTNRTGIRNFDSKALVYILLGLLIYGFIAVTLFQKRSDIVLIFAISALIVFQLISTVLTLFPIILDSGFSYIISTLLSHMLYLLPELLILGLAVYCYKKKDLPTKSVIPKLWFIPGIIRILLAAHNLFTLFNYSSLLADMRPYALYNVLRSLLNVAIDFLLAYWVSYIYTIKLPTAKATAGDVSSYSSIDAPIGPSTENKFCGACGSEISGSNEFCPFCGSSIADQFVKAGHTASTGTSREYGNRAGYDADAPSIGFAVLCFFFPIVGLILYLVWRETMPLRARSCGKGAIISVALWFALMILLVVLSAYLFSSNRLLY